MSFQKGNGQEVSITSNVSANDYVLVHKGSTGNVVQATVQKMAEPLGFFTSADAASLISQEVSAELAAQDLLTSAEGVSLITQEVSAQVASLDIVTSAEVSDLVSAQVEAGGFTTSAAVSVQIDAKGYTTSAAVASQISAEGFLTSASATSFVESTSAGISGAVLINTLVGVTSAQYAALGTPASNVAYWVLDAD